MIFQIQRKVAASRWTMHIVSVLCIPFVSSLKFMPSFLFRHCRHTYRSKDFHLLRFGSINYKRHPACITMAWYRHGTGYDRVVFLFMQGRFPVPCTIPSTVHGPDAFLGCSSSIYNLPLFRSILSPAQAIPSVSPYPQYVRPVQCHHRLHTLLSI